MLTTVAITVAGLLLVVLACYDAILATVAPTTAPGPLMRGWLAVAVRLPEAGCDGCSRRARGLLPGTVILWTALLWVGWTLVLGAGCAPIVDSTTKAPADLASRLYYAG